MTSLFVKGTITKTFFFMLGLALIIVSIGMAWSLIVRGFCVVSTAPKKPVHPITQAAGAYSMDMHIPKPPTSGTLP